MTPYGRRTRTLPAPPHVVWQDLVAPATTGPRVWLDLRHDEVRPQVLESEAPHRVVWSSLWPSRPDDRVVLEVASSSSGTALTFTLMAYGEPPDASTTGHVRRRVNELLYADLRYSYGQ